MALERLWGPGPAASGVCKFDSSNGFGLHPCHYLSLRLISPLSYGARFTNGYSEYVVPVGIGTCTESGVRPALEGGCSPRMGPPENQGTLGSPACGRRGPAGPGAVSGATASWRLHSARRGVARPGPQMCTSCSPGSRGSPPMSCPFWTDVRHNSSPSVRPGQTNGFVSDGRLPYLPLMATDACCLGIPGSPGSLCPPNHRTLSLPEMHSCFLSILRGH